MSDTRIYFQSQPILPVEKSGIKQNVQTGTVTMGASFADILQSATKKVSFSNHAMQRMESRNLNLSTQDLQKLDDTVDMMAKKGARESLIYMNDMALVVRVVDGFGFTAMDGERA